MSHVFGSVLERRSKPSEFHVDRQASYAAPSRDEVVTLVQELRRVVREAREVEAALAAAEYANDDLKITAYEVASARAVVDFYRPEEDFGSGLAGE
jgi:hypothetical protein